MRCTRRSPRRRSRELRSATRRSEPTNVATRRSYGRYNQLFDPSGKHVMYTTDNFHRIPGGAHVAHRSDDNLFEVPGGKHIGVFRGEWVFKINGEPMMYTEKK